MTDEQAREMGDNALLAVRRLGEHYGCRIEINSDTIGALGKFCCTAADADRERQGFGGSVSSAVHNLAHQPARGSTGKAR